MIRIKEPELNRPWKIKHWIIMGACALAACLIFISLYLPFGKSALGPVEWLITLVWVILGLALAFISRFRSKKITDSERERLIFGSRYSRPDRYEG